MMVGPTGVTGSGVGVCEGDTPGVRDGVRDGGGGREAPAEGSGVSDADAEGETEAVIEIVGVTEGGPTTPTGYCDAYWRILHWPLVPYWVPRPRRM